MEKQTQGMADAMGALAENAHALMTATADVAGQKVSEARQRLAATLESAKGAAGRVCDKAVEKARVVDRQVHQHPYRALGIVFGVGLLLGILVTRQHSRED